MIRIQKASEIESAFFGGRDFGSSIDVVRDVLNDVRANGDAAVQKYSKQFDVASPSALEIPQAELKTEKKKMQKENPDLYLALCYSRDLAVRFAKKQRESFDDFEVELEPGLFTGQTRWRLISTISPSARWLRTRRLTVPSAPANSGREYGLETFHIVPYSDLPIWSRRW